MRPEENRHTVKGITMERCSKNMGDKNVESLVILDDVIYLCAKLMSADNSAFVKLAEEIEKTDNEDAYALIAFLRRERGGS